MSKRLSLCSPACRRVVKETSSWHWQSKHNLKSSLIFFTSPQQDRISINMLGCAPNSDCWTMSRSASWPRASACVHMMRFELGRPQSAARCFEFNGHGGHFFRAKLAFLTQKFRDQRRDCQTRSWASCALTRPLKLSHIVHL